MVQGGLRAKRWLFPHLASCRLGSCVFSRLFLGISPLRHGGDDGGEDVGELLGDEEFAGGAEVVEEVDEGVPEADAGGVGAVVDDDRFALHEGIALMAEDHEGEEFLEGAGAAGHDDEGIGMFDHHLHAGVDVRAEPEGGEAIGEAFEFDDVGDVRAPGPAAGLHRAADDGAHDAGSAGPGDAAEAAVGEDAAEHFAFLKVGFVLEGGGAEDADISHEIRRRRGIGLGQLAGRVGFAAGVGQAGEAGLVEGAEHGFGGIGREQEIRDVLADGAEAVEVFEDVEEVRKGHKER